MEDMLECETEINNTIMYLNNDSKPSKPRNYKSKISNQDDLTKQLKTTSSNGEDLTIKSQKAKSFDDSENNVRKGKGMIDVAENNIKNFVQKGKIISDVIHGSISLSNIAISIIDTPIYKRLTQIKQTGQLIYRYPCATHTRFEHSIGVCHLTGISLEKIIANTIERKDGHKEINLALSSDEFTKNYLIKYHNFKNEEEIINYPTHLFSTELIEFVKIAGLIHDLGHGPFSHLFDEWLSSKEELKNNHLIEHEDRSIELLKLIVESSEFNYKIIDGKTLLNSNQQFKKIPLKNFITNDAINFIERIVIPNSTCNNNFIFQIVANQFNGFDVDKLDYIVRDSHYLLNQIPFRYDELLNYAVIINGKISYPSKIKNNILYVYQQRYKLHKEFYNESVVICVETMIKSMLNGIDTMFNIVKSLKNHDLTTFIMLNDYTILNIANNIILSVNAVSNNFVNNNFSQNELTNNNLSQNELTNNNLSQNELTDNNLSQNESTNINLSQNESTDNNNLQDNLTNNNNLQNNLTNNNNLQNNLTNNNNNLQNNLTNNNNNLQDNLVNNNNLQDNLNNNNDNILQDNLNNNNDNILQDNLVNNNNNNLQNELTDNNLQTKYFNIINTSEFKHLQSITERILSRQLYECIYTNTSRSHNKQETIEKIMNKLCKKYSVLPEKIEIVERTIGLLSGNKPNPLKQIYFYENNKTMSYCIDKADYSNLLSNNFQETLLFFILKI